MLFFGAGISQVARKAVPPTSKAKTRIRMSFEILFMAILVAGNA